MKPFDLKEHKKNPAREVVTRDGHKVRIVCTDKMGSYPVVALIFKDGDEIVKSYTERGYAVYGNIDSMDLFFAPVKHKGWINIYKDHQGFSGQRIYDTEESAKKASLCVTHYFTTIPIEWEE